MKNLIKTSIFIIIFLFLGHLIFSVIWFAPTPLREFYREPKNTIDVVYIGASNAFAHFNTVYAYHKYGFTTGLMSNNSQPAMAYKYLIADSQKRQDPRVYVIDISASTSMEKDESTIRFVADSMPTSLNRFKLVTDLLKNSDIPKKDYLNFYFSFFTYHNLWKYINKDYFKSSTLYKGYLLETGTIKIEPGKKETWSDDLKDLPENIDKVYNDLLKFLQKEKLTVIFVISPRNYGDEAMERLNTLTKKINDAGFNVLNFNKIPDVGIDYKKDFYNFAHINVFGATKYSVYFANYLHNHYDLPDHRRDDKYKEWDKEYVRFKESYTSLLQGDFEELVKEDEEKILNYKK